MHMRGLTRIELLVLLVIVAAVIAYAVFVLNRARSGAYSAYDAMQIGQLHKANVIYARDSNGKYMIPGLVKRLPIPPVVRYAPAGIHPPAIGPEDHALNTTPNMYSALIAQEFFGPDLTVGRTEMNPNVRVKYDYNHNAYNPQAGIFWDDTFRVDLDKPGGEAHASYAHLAIAGLRKTEMWRATQSSSQPVFSTRSPRDGIEAGPVYDNSLTLQLHGKRDQWVGNVCFNDNHLDTITSFSPTSYQQVSDNIFAAEFDAQLDGICSERTNPELAGDAWLLIYSAINHWPSQDWMRCVKSLDGRYD